MAQSCRHVTPLTLQRAATNTGWDVHFFVLFNCVKDPPPPPCARAPHSRRLSGCPAREHNIITPARTYAPTSRLGGQRTNHYATTAREGGWDRQITNVVISHE